MAQRFRNLSGLDDRSEGVGNGGQFMTIQKTYGLFSPGPGLRRLSRLVGVTPHDTFREGKGAV